MAKPDPALLDPARYPFQCRIETRYRDLDSNLHINNGVMASLLEEGRVRFHRVSNLGNVGRESGITAMVVSLGIEFIGQSHFPDPIDLHVGVSRLGASSYELTQLATQGGEAIVFARATMVCVKGGRPATIADNARDAAQEWMLA